MPTSFRPPRHPNPRFPGKTHRHPAPDAYQLRKSGDERDALPLFVERFASTGIELLSAGYAFQVETTQLAHLAGARIEEVPLVFSQRIAGASKMTLRISLEGIRVTLALRRHRPRGRRTGLRAAL